MDNSILKRVAALASALVLAGCATPPAPYDYTAFKAAKPATILVLPPLNETTDVKATYGVMSQATQPLAEAGYYVFPVTLVDESFRENGITLSADAHAVGLEKLQSVFGPDAVLYLKVKRYGTTYLVVSSDTTVALEAKLVDGRSGQVLWEGAAQASTAENQNSQGGLVGMLVKAVVDQIINSSVDHSFNLAGVASSRLLTVNRTNGMLPGPRLKTPKSP